MRNGTLWGCGLNTKGQLGLGNTTNKTSIVKLNISDVVLDLYPVFFTIPDTKYITFTNPQNQVFYIRTIFTRPDSNVVNYVAKRKKRRQPRAAWELSYFYNILFIFIYIGLYA